MDDAIAAVAALLARGVAAHLLHARFALADRKRVEAEVLAQVGKEGRGRAGYVLVGTQVLESSLELDFDVMISDTAPTAALIQRVGRFWRHMDVRQAATRPISAPVLHVLSPDPDQDVDDRWLQGTLGSGAYVYTLCDLWRSAKVLLAARRTEAPKGLRSLVEAARALIRNGTCARFYNVIDLVNRLEAESRSGKQGRLADYMTRLDFVILDRLGCLPFAKSGGQLLSHLNSRLFESTSIIVTTNLACEWPTVFGPSQRLRANAYRAADAKVTTALFVRLTRLRSVISSVGSGPDLDTAERGSFVRRLTNEAIHKFGQPEIKNTGLVVHILRLD